MRVFIVQTGAGYIHNLRVHAFIMRVTYFALPPCGVRISHYHQHLKRNGRVSNSEPHKVSSAEIRMFALDGDHTPELVVADDNFLPHFISFASRLYHHGDPASFLSFQMKRRNDVYRNA